MKATSHHHHHHHHHQNKNNKNNNNNNKNNKNNNNNNSKNKQITSHTHKQINIYKHYNNKKILKYTLSMVKLQALPEKHVGLESPSLLSNGAHVNFSQSSPLDGQGCRQKRPFRLI